VNRFENGLKCCAELTQATGRIVAIFVLAAAATFTLARAAAAQDGYQKPPEAVLRVLHALPTPVASLGRDRGTVMLVTPVVYPPIAKVAQPFARLAGLRIDVATNGPHDAPMYDNLVFKKLRTAAKCRLLCRKIFIFPIQCGDRMGAR
jgi:hypothetical protein